MTADIARLDVTQAAVEREVWLRQQAARAAWLPAHPREAEQIHQLDPADRALADMAAAHPEALTSQSGNPDWDRWLAKRIAECEATRRTT